MMTDKIESAKSILYSTSSKITIAKTESAIEILNDTNLDEQSIITAYIYIPFSHKHITKQQIIDQFGEPVYQMVFSLNELHKIQYNNEQEEAENIRKMYFAVTKDFRLIFIKLAFVVGEMKNQELFNPEDVKLKAKQNLDLFAPLAARLGLSRIKTELEDQSFRILHPLKYKEIESAVEQKFVGAQQMIDEIQLKLGDILKELKISGEIMGRRKHAYSIYKKLLNKKENFDSIYDLVALRVLVNTLPECYSVLGKINEIFVPIRGRFKDYIATPKSNGYQSLHTTILFEGLPVEIQIRTFDMHKSAEYGYAAHWIYKEKRTKQDSLDEKLGWVRQILEEHDTFTSSEMIDSLKVDIYDGEIFVQSPLGKVVHLPEGSSPIDFAYAIHSEVGNKMTGAQINGKMRPITTKLQNGDIVNIITSKTSAGPSRDWLKQAKTLSAKHKIRQFFKKEMKEENIRIGKSMLELACKNHNLILTELEETKDFTRLLNRNSFVDINELFASIGSGTTSANVVVNYFIQIKKKEMRQRQKQINVSTEYSPEKHIEVDGADNLLIKIAPCCKPEPGDEIVGYVSQGRGLIIHKTNCEHIKYYDINRMLEAHWK